MIKLKRCCVFLEAQGIDVQRFVLLRGADVVEDGAGGDGGCIVADKAEAFEGFDVELAFDERDGEVVREDPVFDAGAGGDSLQFCRNFCAMRKKDFVRPGHQDCVYRLCLGIRAGKLGGAELAGGDVEQCYGVDGLALGGGFEEGGEEVVLLLRERGIERGAGGEDAGHFAADDFLRQLGVFHLVADGDAEAAA